MISGIGKVLGEGTFGKVVLPQASLQHFIETRYSKHRGKTESVEYAAGQLVESKGDHVRGVLVAVKMLKEGHTDAEMIDFCRRWR